jgi:hypothetical protein
MQLAMTVVSIVLGVTAVVGIVGYLIDRSAERHERTEGR